MSENTYAPIAFTPSDKKEPFRFVIGEGEGRKGWSEKFELPALDDPGIPLEILEAYLVMRNADSGSDTALQVALVFLRFFRESEKDLYRALNRHTQTSPLLMGLIEQWGEHTQVDPKA